MLKISDLFVKFEDFKLENINFTLLRGEYFVILGKSGAGKTVLLETIAGRYKPKSGKIIQATIELTTLEPEKREVGFVYQNYELFPHMTVEENIAFGLKIRKMPKEQIIRKTREMLKFLSIDEIKYNYPLELSGGEKQRTALGRALAIEPRLLLLDEPISALDYLTKNEIKKGIKEMCKSFRPTVIHVTHDIEEALYFADKIGIIKNHTLSQVFEKEDLLIMKKEDFYEYI